MLKLPMNQKRFLTLLPIIFILLVTVIILVIYFTNKDDNGDVLGVSCTEEFIDEGLGIHFAYPCEWELSLETTIGDDFVYSESNRYGYVAEKYFLRFKEGDQLLQIRVVLADTKGSILSMENKYEYKVIDDKVIRFTREDNYYKYGKYINCDELQNNQLAGVIQGKDCSRTMVFGVSEKFPAIIEVYNPSDLDLIDKFISSISNV
jgi:hypothetical protein